jgi:hypothetical protein
MPGKVVICVNGTVMHGRQDGLRTKGISKKGNPYKPVVAVMTTVAFNVVSTIQETIKRS